MLIQKEHGFSFTPVTKLCGDQNVNTRHENIISMVYKTRQKYVFFQRRHPDQKPQNPVSKFTMNGCS
jgi:hypothetical protein